MTALPFRRGVLPCSLLVVACGIDVVVGANPRRTSLDASADLDGALDDGNVADVSGGDGTFTTPSGALGAARLGDRVLVAGFQGGVTGEETTSDALLEQLEGTGLASATEVFSPTSLAAASDRANAVAVRTDLVYAAVGHTTLGDGRRVPWLRRYGADHVLSFARTIDEGSTGSAEAVAFSSDGSLIVIGNEGAGERDGWAAGYDDTGTRSFYVPFRTRWSLVGGSATEVRSVAIDSLGRILVGGHRRAKDGGSATIPTLVQLSPAGEIWGSSDSLFGTSVGEVRSVLYLSTGDAIACADLDGRAAFTRVLAGPTASAIVLETDASPLRLAGCAATAADLYMAVTVERPTGPVPRIYRYELATLSKVSSLDPAVIEPTRVHAIAVASGGRIYLAGQTATTSQRAHLFASP